jgi:hypothetical protein
MGDAPEWPAYQTGPRDSIFALGVASTKFNELESSLRFIFGTVFDLNRDDTTMIAAKIGNEAVVILTRQKLPETGWPQQHQDDIAYFLKAFGICATNRDHLAHSAIAWIIADKTILFKTTKQGTTHMAAPTLTELRLVADDMNTYSEYGRQLGNAINNRLWQPPVFPPSAFPWPDRPALPRSLDYSPDPRPA